MGLFFVAACSSLEDWTGRINQSVSSNYSTSGVDRKLYNLITIEAKNALGTTVLPVRGNNPQLKGTSIYTPRLEPVTSLGLKTLLSKRYTLIAGEKPVIKDKGWVFSASNGHFSMWIEKSTGIFLLVDRIRSGKGILDIYNDQQAVDVAVRHLARNGLLTLTAGESLDVLSVARTVGVMVDKSTKKPVPVIYSNRPPSKIHTVEYTTTFGRRFLGVPIVGSRIQVRMSPAGKLLGVFAHARRISGSSVKPVSFQDTTVNFAARLNQAARADGFPGGVKEISSACGFIEGPFGYKQTELLPGCAVKIRAEGFKVGRPVYVRLSATGLLLGTKT
jgi:hypothetical protein